MQISTQQTHYLPYNVEVANSKDDGFTPIYRKRGLTELISSPHENIRSLRDLLIHAKTQFGSQEILGEIVVAKEVVEGKTVEKRNVRMRTFNQVFQAAQGFGRYLLQNGLFSKEEERGMKLVGIFSKNRYEWFVSDWAFSLSGLTAVPLYDTLGHENLSYCLDLTGVNTLLISSGTLPALLSLHNIGSLKTIISFDTLDAQQIAKIKARGLDYLEFWTLSADGNKLPATTEIKIEFDDCASFSFTSGTTGPPKGALLSHRNFLSCVAGFTNNIDLSFNSNDTHLSYLPLPHMMERTLVWMFFYTGSKVVISSGNILKLRDDCQAAKVTVLVSVPRILSRIAESIKNKFIELKMPVFKHPAVFAKVRESFGGKLRMIASGSAPLSVETIQYLEEAFGCPLIEGYGQTQSSAGALFHRYGDPCAGSLSELSSGLEMKLCDIPEMHYSSKDIDEQGRPCPRGELWQRGPQVFLGYYKQPEVTKQTLTSDGWLRSGDVAQMQLNGNGFRIIDRRKNIFKLQQGEYLAPDRIENKYMISGFLSEVFLHGDSHQYFAVAIVTPNPEAFVPLCRQNGLNHEYAELVKSVQAKKVLLKAINEVGRKEGLHGFELAKNIYLEPSGFLTKGILTNTMKLIRHSARIVYKEQINQLYQEGEIEK